MDRPPRPYAHVAWCYDAIASAYSLGVIERAKRWHVSRVKPGGRVLYVGAGTGREVALSCVAGANVVCVEPCGAMARRLRKRLSPWAERVTIIEKPLRPAEGAGEFDWVCGHFFFNVFDAATMPEMVAMAASHVKPGGRMAVADFAPGRGLSIDRLARAAYYRPVNIAGWGFGMCALHPIYDYMPALEGLGFSMEARVKVHSFLRMPALYEVVCARKRQGGRSRPAG